ncbi:co-chaperone DjlA [Immundisolibacter sp.]|uniref:co-chaperone DjlA n=1 Tax=Immundisolibacter sp. TaxID=1934948 RepID=UPI0035627215
MALWGKLIGGVAGLMVGGPLGALLGVAAGHTVDQAREPTRSLPHRGRRLALDALVERGFALMGYIAKADGRVSEREIAVAEAWMQRLVLTPTQRQRAMDRFEAGKQPGFSAPRAADELRREVGIDIRQLHIVLEMLVGIARADGRLSASSRQALVGVLSQLGLPAAALDAVLGQQGTTGGGRRGAPNAPRIAQDYALLGVSPNADVADIKRAYRRLMSRHHPDRAGDDAGATARAQGINEAYRRVREARGF